MEYVVDLENFDGPLDLLLYLVKDSKLDIMEVDMKIIADQYLEYIKNFEKLNLNIASEYLVVAAELIELKSYLLLPKKEIEASDEEYEEDPETRMRNALLEYARYKEIANSLREYEQERNSFYSKEPFELSDIDVEKEKINENFKIDDLVEALNQMIIRKEKQKPLSTKITTKEYSITQRSTEIKSILKKKKKLEFTELFDNYAKDYIVVTFLSILNMARHNEIDIVQDKNFDKILLELRGDMNE